VDHAPLRGHTGTVPGARKHRSDGVESLAYGRTQGAAASPLGYSVGRLEEDSLVVTTTHLNWPFFHQLGVPQTENSVLVERLRASADGGRLDYELTVSDPAVFTEPVTGQRHWFYRPGEEIQPYDCTVRENR
jgi:hypothetical protein